MNTTALKKPVAIGVMVEPLAQPTTFESELIPSSRVFKCVFCGHL